MKKINLTLVCFSVLILSAFLACNSEELSSTSSNEQQPVPESIKSFSQNIGIDDAIQIGEVHNEILGSALSNNPSSFSELKSSFDSINYEGFTQELKDEIYTYFEENSIVEQESYIKSEFRSIVSDSILAIVKNIVFDSENFDGKSTQLDEVITTIINLNESESLDNRDKEILLTLTETTRSSLSFWMSVEDGGQGMGDLFYVSGNTRDGINWGAIAWADGAGAAGTLLRAWALAGFGPLGWSAVIGAIGWGAAWGSGSALLYQLL